MQTMLPKLIVTRPAPSGAAFAQKIRAACGYEITTIVAPGLKIVPLEASVPAQIDQLIFTSAHGVAQVERLGLPRSARAWCVGDRTGQAARALGFEVSIGSGDALGLVQTIIHAKPAGHLLHVAGRNTIGDIAKKLQSAGLNCEQITAYDQILCPPTEEVKNAMSGDQPLVIPLFSVRSGLMLTQTEWRARTHIVAISQNVAEAAIDWGVDTVTIAQSPDEKAMIAATCAALDHLQGGASVA